MLIAYSLSEHGPRTIHAAGGETVPADANWIDLIQPTREEDRAAEAFLNASLPTREEAQEIEFSSRFYVEDGAVFMTASVLTGVDLGKPTLVPLTLVVAGDNRIATLRYEDLRAQKQFLARATKPGSGCATTPGVFFGLIEAIVDRTADVLEKISADVDRINSEVFATRTETRRGRRLAQLMEGIGAQGDLAAKARESLSSLERLVQFAGIALPSSFGKGANKNRLKLLARDVRSLEDHCAFLSNKILFLLDATLGLISVEQNEVIRILTVAATIFFPPTLIGTIYGMNFQNIPELNWHLGYPLAIILMLASAVLPYLYFKRRGWL
ncbi:MAG TPA: magnesium transporter CorA family protein [Bauldia sp.]|nr:magnesium transporter CorA family protein [Bauldia sp.]